MSTTLISTGRLTVASYCGPDNTSEHTRMMLQIGNPQGTEDVTLQYSDARDLHRVISSWLNEYAPDWAHSLTPEIPLPSDSARKDLDARITAGLQSSPMGEPRGADTDKSARVTSVPVRICGGCKKPIDPRIYPGQVALLPHRRTNDPIWDVSEPIMVDPGSVELFCSVACMRDWCNRILEIG